MTANATSNYAIVTTDGAFLYTNSIRWVVRGKREINAAFTRFMNGYNTAIRSTTAKRLTEGDLFMWEKLRHQAIPLEYIRALQREHQKDESWCAGYYLGLDAAIDAESIRILNKERKAP